MHNFLHIISSRGIGENCVQTRKSGDLALEKRLQSSSNTLNNQKFFFISDAIVKFRIFVDTPWKYKLENQG